MSFLKDLFGNRWITILGGILIGLFTNGVYEFVKQDFFTGSVLIFISLIMAYFLYQINKNKSHLSIDKGDNIPPTPHIISGLSFLNIVPIEEKERADGRVSNIRLIFNLVEKHQPVLKQLHLVVSKTSGVQASQAELSKWLEAQSIKPKDLIQDIEIVDASNIGEVFQAVDKHLKKLEKNGVNLKAQVLIDITAGTAAISAGLTMAALANGCNITYQATSRAEGDKLAGITSWQFYKNRIVQIWESFPQHEG